MIRESILKASFFLILLGVAMPYKAQAASLERGEADQAQTETPLQAMLRDGHKGGDKAVPQRIRVATEGLANPERGFRFEILVGQENSSTEDFWPFKDYRDDGIVMTQAYCYLTDYWNSPISQSKLDALQASFDRARRDGVKFVLRFAYLNDYDQTNGPTLERILSHIEQLTDIVRRNIDVIYTLQIGWIGVWGEFHHDANKLDQDPKAVAAVVEATLKMLPENRSTMMRCMRYRTTAKKANEKIDLSRVGFFNDATLTNATDAGTFLKFAYDGDPEFDELTEKSAHFPVEGEMWWNGEARHPAHTFKDNPKGEHWSDRKVDLQMSNALAVVTRFIKHHYTTFSVVHLNSELDRAIYGSIDAWKKTPFTASLLKAQNLPVDEKYFERNPIISGYEYIRDHLGYRLEATRVEGCFTGKEYQGKIVVRNVGFSRPVNPRPTYLVLYNKKGAAYEFPTGTDARSFEPWEEVEVKLAGKLPDNAPAGPYFAALWLPDEEESIKYRPEYAITLAEGTQREVLGGRVLNRIE